MKKKKEYSQTDVVDILKEFINKECGGSSTEAAKRLGARKSFIGDICSRRERPPASIFKQLLGEEYESHRQIIITYKKVKNGNKRR